MVDSAYLRAVISFHVGLRMKCRDLVLGGNSFLWCSVGATRTFALLPLGQRCEGAKVNVCSCDDKLRSAMAKEPYYYRYFAFSLSRSITCNLMEVVARCLLNALGCFWYASALNTLVAFVL